MSFADDLNNAYNHKNDSMLEYVCKSFYEDFQRGCKYFAEQGYHSYHGLRFSQYFNEHLSDNDEYKERFGNYLNDADYAYFENYIQMKLKKDGFKNSNVIKKSIQQYRKEYEYVEYSGGEKLFAGILGTIGQIDDTQGYRKGKSVKAGYRYDIIIDAEW